MKTSIFFVLLNILFVFSACSGGSGVKPEENQIKAGVYQKSGVVLFVYKPSRVDVTNVALIGDFDGWSSGGYSMIFDRGIWKISLNLEPGTYQYKYVLNGSSYVPDPTATASSPDGKGGKNSILEVGGTH